MLSCNPADIPPRRECFAIAVASLRHAQVTRSLRMTIRESTELLPTNHPGRGRRTRDISQPQSRMVRRVMAARMMPLRLITPKPAVTTGSTATPESSSTTIMEISAAPMVRIFKSTTSDKV